MKHFYAIKFFFLGLLFTACTTPQNITYFQDLDDGQIEKLANYKGITLKPADMVSIVVNTKTTELTNLLNLPLSTQLIGSTEITARAQSQGISGYTLDSEGNIDFPMVGKLRLAGLTREAAAAHVKKALEDNNVATNPVVTVEFLNLKYSVMGEVNSPGEYNLVRDKMSIVEALSKAGDMTLYGMRDSVLVYRDNNGQRETYVLNMLSGKDIIGSPAYYLQQNDIIYVKPSKYRRRQSTLNGNQLQSTSFWISLASLFTTAAILLK